MVTTAISDETLMALADGELGEQEAAALRARIAGDPDLARRFAVFVETRALVQRPLPASNVQRDELADRIVALDRSLSASGSAVRAASPSIRIIDGGASASRDGSMGLRPIARAQPWWKLPLAAALILALGGLTGYRLALDLSPDGAPATGILALPAAASALDRALSVTPSGGEVGWSGSGLSGRVLLVSSHVLDDGTLCREFEISVDKQDVSRIVGASCRRDETWRTEIAVAVPDSDSAYSPASGTAAVEQYLAARGSTGPLAPADERARLNLRSEPQRK